MIPALFIHELLFKKAEKSYKKYSQNKNKKSRRLKRRNPVSKNAMIGLGVAAAAVLYLMTKKPATPVATVASTTAVPSTTAAIANDITSIASNLLSGTMG